LSWATSLEEPEKLNRNEIIHANTFNVVKKSWKSVQQILW